VLNNWNLRLHFYKIHGVSVFICYSLTQIIKISRFYIINFINIPTKNSRMDLSQVTVLSTNWCNLFFLSTYLRILHKYCTYIVLINRSEAPSYWYQMFWSSDERRFVLDYSISKHRRLSNSPLLGYFFNKERPNNRVI